MKNLLFVLSILGIVGMTHATTIGLGDAAQYNVFALNGSYVFMGNDTTDVYGDMGIAADSHGALTKGSLNGGTVYIDSSIPLTDVTVDSGFFPLVDRTQSLAQANQDAITASSALDALATNRFDVTALTGAANISATIAGDNIFELSSVNLNNVIVNLSGTADDYFIFNVTGGFSFLGSSTINLSGGLVAEHIIWNIIGGDPGVEVELRGDSTMRGTVLAPDRAIQVDHGSIYGQLIGGRDSTFTGLDKDGASFSIHSAFQVYSAPFTPVPEPATLALLGLGGGLLLRKRK